MLSQLRQRIEDVLRAFGGDEDAFNRFAEAERLGVYLRHGRIYATAIGQSHTARLAAAGVEVAAPDTGRKSLAMYAFSPPEGIP